MALAEEIHSQDLIKPYADIIIDAIRSAWKEWVNSPFFGKWSSRGRATFVWETVTDSLKDKFRETRDIYILDKGTTVLFVVKQEIAFRFKLADKSGRSKNVQTKSARSFHDPELDYNLLAESGVSSDIPRVEVVYSLNKTATQIDNIKMIARDKSALVWNTSLISTQESFVEVFDVSNNIVDNESKAKRRFKPKSTDTVRKNAVGEQ